MLKYQARISIFRGRNKPQEDYILVQTLSDCSLRSTAYFENINRCKKGF